MKRIALALCLALALAGCRVANNPSTQPSTFTPAQTLILGTDTLTATLNTIADARDLGLITQADIDPFKPTIDGILSVRAQAEKDLRAGNVTDAQGYLNQYQVALNKLGPLLAKISAKKVTTQPSH